MISSSSAIRAYAARAATRAAASSGAYSSIRTATPMCSSTNSRRTSWLRAPPAEHASAVTVTRSRCRMLMAAKISLLLLAQTAPYRDSIPGTRRCARRALGKRPSQGTSRRRQGRRRAGPVRHAGQRGRVGHRHGLGRETRRTRRIVERSAGPRGPDGPSPAGARLERDRSAIPQEPLVARRCTVRRLPHRPRTLNREELGAMSRKSQQSRDVTRREFVHTSAAAAAALTFPGAPTLVGVGRADTLRIGLVGCGGRGTGAAKACLTSSERVELVAIGDLFPDRVTECRANLARMANEDTSGGLKAKIKLDDAHAFSGFDAYQKVIGSKVDVVLLATPPAFRARHLAAAIEAGKHVFMEKPVAVDPVGVRAVIASADLAAQKGLAIVAGTQRRHDAGYRAAIQRIHNGAIGDIVAAQVYWNQGGLWMKPRQPQWSDVEWQIRNWLYFTWLSGDHIVEQHIHNIGVANWALGAHPMKAVGVGGRQWRTDPAYGHIYDHFAIDFEYANGVHVLSMCRQIDGTASHVAERIVGTHGRSDGHSVIEGAAPWSWDAQTPRTNPYVQEHADLIASIRAGKPLNEGRPVAETTLSAIMGREAA